VGGFLFDFELFRTASGLTPYDTQVKSDEDGNIDLEDFRAKAEKHKDNLSAIMVTYPSTYGVFEETITAPTQRLH